MNKLGTRISWAMGLMTVAGVTLGPAAAERAGDERVKLSEVPAAVRTTIRQHLAGGTIEQIERSREGGKTVYEVEVEGAAGDFEFSVAADGTFLGLADEADEEHGDHDDGDAGEQTTEIGFVDAPASVVTRAQPGPAARPLRRRNASRITGSRSTRSNTRAAAPAEHVLLRPRRNPRVRNTGRCPFDPRGDPSADHEGPSGATIESAEAVQLFYYEIDVVVDGRTIEVAAFATGELEGRMSGDHEDEDHDGDDDGHEDDDEHEDHD